MDISLTLVRMGNEGKIIARDNGSTLKPFVHVIDAAGDLMEYAVNNRLKGHYNVAGNYWRARSTVAEMRKIQPVEVQWGEAIKGWIGDPLGLQIERANRRHTIEEGVRDALKSLGWS